MQLPRRRHSTPTPDAGEAVSLALSRSGNRRLTPQRRHVYEALMEQPDHPTANDVFIRAREKMPTISLATVYNCLEALTESGLIKHVNLERAPSRYCANTLPHGHLFCDGCGAVEDVPLKHATLEQSWEIPAGSVVSHVEVTLRGLCPVCAGKP